MHSPPSWRISSGPIGSAAVETALPNAVGPRTVPKDATVKEPSLEFPGSKHAADKSATFEPAAIPLAAEQNGAAIHCIRPELSLLVHIASHQFQCVLIVFHIRRTTIAERSGRFVKLSSKISHLESRTTGRCGEVNGSFTFQGRRQSLREVRLNIWCVFFRDGFREPARSSGRSIGSKAGLRLPKASGTY